MPLEQFAAFFPLHIFMYATHILTHPSCFMYHISHLQKGMPNVKPKKLVWYAYIYVYESVLYVFGVHVKNGTNRKMLLELGR